MPWSRYAGLSFLMDQLMDSNGKENIGALNSVKLFLGWGLELVYLQDEDRTASRTIYTSDANWILNKAATRGSLSKSWTTLANPFLGWWGELVLPRDASSYANHVVVRIHSSVIHGSLVILFLANLTHRMELIWHTAHGCTRVQSQSWNIHQQLYRRK